jgi:hypothetical protein
MSDLNLENKQIKFPKQHYIGMIGRQGDTLPLGFMTEDGTDKGAVKRKGTVDDWVRSNSYARDGEKKIAVARTYENTPLIGFRLTKSIRRNSSWGAGNVKWRIEDPRGFELEITSPNMARIMDSCVIDNGEILEECVWARLKGDNVLVPVSSDLYQAATRNEERLANKVKPSEVERGDEVVLHNGMEGIYLGKFECLQPNYRYQDNDRKLFEFEWKAKPVHAMVTKGTDHQGNPTSSVHTFATFKPSYVTKREGGPLTPEQAEALVWEVGVGGYRSERLFLSKSQLEFKETPVVLADYMTNDEYRRNGHLCVIKADGSMHTVHLSKWQYDEYVKSKTAPPQPHRSTFTYGRDRLAAETSRVSRNADGNYVIHYTRNAYSGRPTITVGELEELQLVEISATLKTSDGKPQIIR